MMWRFSTKMFVVTSVIHLSGTLLLFWCGHRSWMLMHEGVPQSRFAFTSLTTAAWLWSSAPMLLSQFVMVKEPVFVLWSLCVGVIGGFLAPHTIGGSPDHLTSRCS